ncbi:50S ribosomal protein L24 [Candidatus Woesearchaeota archaeon]|jgi:large subunit ribosomal protein L24|nr:50S ribosomal protein L24 [Candidatus Woesearchaeota archaeon]MBT4368709.1 50S ribosomal protein L24 [Candidatus Woesearchaeota archaeon]MBT4711998.1 50S ribosomal protein L24 [Candidatus Woesearchaeota archaeon]MBT6638893.1 50S ribosomal protein L24 [Candidatus Woesearchaeota archaeon]MBT7134537.1 50S ribosomal protein L24 [Candidatus Woesearchaeota archaeon]
MKTTFSTTWKNSTQPRKQRKYRHNAPLHIKKKFLGGHLCKELRTQHKIRTIGIKKGDKVKVMRGKHKGKTGSVEKVSVQHTKIYIQGLDFKKRDGSRSLYPLEPSNIMIMELNLEDKKRMKTIQSESKTTQAKPKKTEEKASEPREKPKTTEKKESEQKKTSGTTKVETKPVKKTEEKKEN